MSNDVNCGYVKIDKYILKPLCEKCINYIYNVRKQKEDDFVTKFINKWNEKAVRRNENPFIGWLFPIKIYTDIEEVKKIMDKSYKESGYFEGFEYDYHSDWGAYELRKIEDILECCNNTDIKQEITLSVEIYRQILYGQK